MKEREPFAARWWEPDVTKPEPLNILLVLMWWGLFLAALLGLVFAGALVFG